MIFDASNPFDIEKAKVKFESLISKQKKFELTEKFPMRSIKQNSYFHLLISCFALEYGERFEYVKQEIFKKIVNPDIFYFEYVNRKTGEIRDDWKSSADLNSKEMTLAIDRFRDYSAKEAGIYLPEPKDLNYLEEIKKQVENNKQYL